jgi:uncharacterized protein YabN with tetrapyrrole methylase and pyrophosphatase domain
MKIEAVAKANNTSMDKMTLEEMDAIWKQIKKQDS